MGTFRLPDLGEGLAEAEILEPDEVRAQAAALAREIVARYER